MAGRAASALLAWATRCRYASICSCPGGAFGGRPELGLAGLAAVAQRAGGIEGGLDGGALDVVLERLAATVEVRRGIRLPNWV